MNQRAQDLMMGAPSVVSPKQLRELNIQLSPKAREATEAARSRADIVLMRSDLGNVAPLIQTARAARRRTLENFGVAAVYNTVAIPIAIAGFASPLAAALAMSTSSILVALNALRVR